MNPTAVNDSATLSPPDIAARVAATIDDLFATIDELGLRGLGATSS